MAGLPQPDSSPANVAPQGVSTSPSAHDSKTQGVFSWKIPHVVRWFSQQNNSVEFGDFLIFPASHVWLPKGRASDIVPCTKYASCNRRSNKLVKSRFTPLGSHPSNHNGNKNPSNSVLGSSFLFWGTPHVVNPKHYWRLLGLHHIIYHVVRSTCSMPLVELFFPSEMNLVEGIAVVYPIFRPQYQILSVPIIFP